MDHDKVAIIGSGNWGSAISIIIGKNCQEHDCFDTTVMMYVHNEPVTVTSTVNTATTSNTVTKPLADVINERHENVKYLPGIKLPLNIKATSDIQEACQDATLLVFVTPHQFLMPLMPKIREALTSNSSSSPYSYYYSCRGVNLSKGLDFDEKLKQPVLISTAIEAAMVGSDVGGLQHQQQQQQQRHGFSCGALMGAIVANEVAAGELCEATLACDFGQLTNERTRKLFNAPMFRVQHIYDTSGAQIGGALKNVIALGAGFVDALGLGGRCWLLVVRYYLGITVLRDERIGVIFFNQSFVHFFPYLKSPTQTFTLHTLFASLFRKYKVGLASNRIVRNGKIWTIFL